MFKKVVGAYFSGTGTTKKSVESIGKKLAAELGLPFEVFDFTLPDARVEPKVFNKGDVVVFGTPVIAGRVPNVLLKYLGTLKGDGAVGIPVVCFGNRNFDNALIELRDILIKAGMICPAGCAMACEHSFSTTLGKDRPDREDIAEGEGFAREVAELLKRAMKVAEEETEKEAENETMKEGEASWEGDLGIFFENVEVPGEVGPSYGGYYQPRDREGNPIDIRKVKPVTLDSCNKCGLCARLCPLGSIDFEDVTKFNGICMKCCACVKNCPSGSKVFVDENYLYHQHELEEVYERRAANSFFVIK